MLSACLSRFLSEIQSNKVLTIVIYRSGDLLHLTVERVKHLKEGSDLVWWYFGKCKNFERYCSTLVSYFCCLFFITTKVQLTFITHIC